MWFFSVTALNIHLSASSIKRDCDVLPDDRDRDDRRHTGEHHAERVRSSGSQDGHEDRGRYQHPARTISLVGSAETSEYRRQEELQLLGVSDRTEVRAHCCPLRLVRRPQQSRTCVSYRNENGRTGMLYKTVPSQDRGATWRAQHRHRYRL